MTSIKETNKRNVSKEIIEIENREASGKFNRPRSKEEFRSYVYSLPSVKELYFEMHTNQCVKFVKEKNGAVVQFRSH